MNNFYDSTYWCILQVTSVTIAGLLLTAWARKSPTIASSITSATTVIVVLLTAIAPFPVHRWLAENVSPTEAQTSGPVNHREYNKLTPANDAVPFAQPMFSLQADNFFAAVKTLANQAEQPRRTNAGLLKITGWFCGFALFIGVVRFLYCLHAVRMTRRLGAVIESRDMTVEVRELADRLGSAAAPAVRESFDVSTAAVVGILSPIVILPGEWRDWSKEERRAVLAHELAHVVRQDSFWRIASCWMGAVHFFNPLIHLLLNRVTLYQELAADEMASEAVGRRCYLRSLSTLALRHDNSSSGQRCPQVMPVFTGHLIRRIKMLRSKDGRANTTRNSGRRLMAPVAVMVLLGASLVSMRGFVLADTPDESQASAANPIKVVSKTEVSKRSKASQFPGFHREAIWPAEITQNRHGMFVLRVGELQEQPQLAPFIGLVEAQLNEVVELSLDRASKPGLDLRNVDWIATQATFTLKNNARPQADEKHSLALGTNGLIIRFKESVSLQDWVNKNMNDLERAVLEGQTIFQISTLPAATDVPLKSWMRQIDQNTVQISLYARSEESDSNLATIFGGQPDIPKEHLTSWHRVSRSLNRGLVAFVHTDAEIRRSIDIDDTGSNLLQTVSRLAAALTQRCTTFGYGIDIDEDGKFIVQSRFAHPSYSKADQSRTEIEELLKMLENEPIEDGVDPQEAIVLSKLQQCASATRVETVFNDDGTAEVVTSSKIDFASLLSMANFRTRDRMPE